MRTIDEIDEISVADSALVQGRRAGRAWAARAPLYHLQALGVRFAEDRQHPEIPWHWQFRNDLLSDFTPAERLYYILEPARRGNRTAARQFWQLAVGTLPPWDTDWMVGFAEAASHAWQTRPPRVRFEY